MLASQVLRRLYDPIRYSSPLDAPLKDLVHSARTLGLEGLIAKRLNSRYESGERSGAWLKMRLNRGQEFVIGGYTVAPHTFDAIVFGYYNRGKLVFAAKTRNGFTPSLRESLHKQFRKLQTPTCPFANPPEPKGGRWGQGLTAEKMKDCRWLKPELVAQIEFLEWTPDNHLRHSRFVALREDKNPRNVVHETP